MKNFTFLWGLGDLAEHRKLTKLINNIKIISKFKISLIITVIFLHCEVSLLYIFSASHTYSRFKTNGIFNHKLRATKLLNTSDFQNNKIVNRKHEL